MRRGGDIFSFLDVKPEKERAFGCWSETEFLRERKVLFRGERAFVWFFLGEFRRENQGELLLGGFWEAAGASGGFLELGEEASLKGSISGIKRLPQVRLLQAYCLFFGCLLLSYVSC